MGLQKLHAEILSYSTAANYNLLFTKQLWEIPLAIMHLTGCGYCVETVTNMAHFARLLR